MANDHSKTIYYEVFQTSNEDWVWHVYHHDASGNQMVVMKQSDSHYDNRDEAEDSATDWCEDNGIDAEMG